MKRLGALAGVVALCAGLTGAGVARADHRPSLGTPVVEGDASYRVLLDGDGTVDVAYVCEGRTKGDFVAATFVKCEVRQNKVVVDKAVRGESSNYVLTQPRLITLAEGPFQICWEAYAQTTHATWIYDVTLPNCMDGEAVAS